MSRNKPNRPQIEALAALYHCKVTDGLMGSVFIEYEGRREDIGMWYISKEWTRDEWRSTFERISNTKSAELWSKAKGEYNV